MYITVDLVDGELVLMPRGGCRLSDGSASSKDRAREQEEGR